MRHSTAEPQSNREAFPDPRRCLLLIKDLLEEARKAHGTVYREVHRQRGGCFVRVSRVGVLRQIASLRTTVNQTDPFQLNLPKPGDPAGPLLRRVIRQGALSKASATAIGSHCCYATYAPRAAESQKCSPAISRKLRPRLRPRPRQEGFHTHRHLLAQSGGIPVPAILAVRPRNWRSTRQGRMKSATENKDLRDSTQRGIAATKR